MIRCGFFPSSDNLGYIQQIKATREEVLKVFDDSLANKRVAEVDRDLSFCELSDEEWARIRDELSKATAVMSGTFFEEQVPGGPININGHFLCKCPVSLINNIGGNPNGDAQPWDFIRMWDFKWGTFNYESDRGRRAVIYIED